MHRSISLRPSAAPVLQAEVQILACVSGTIFGRDVVPEVGNISAVSLGLAGSRESAGPESPDSVKRPAASSKLADSSITRTPRKRAARRAGESIPACVI